MTKCFVSMLEKNPEIYHLYWKPWRFPEQSLLTPFSNFESGWLILWLPTSPFLSHLTKFYGFWCVDHLCAWEQLYKAQNLNFIRSNKVEVSYWSVDKNIKIIKVTWQGFFFNLICFLAAPVILAGLLFRSWLM